MNIVSTSSAVARTAAPLAAPAPVAIDNAQAIDQAAVLLLPLLEQGKPITTGALRAAMTESSGGTDAQGFWIWKDAYGRSKPHRSCSSAGSDRRSCPDRPRRRRRWR